MNKIAPILFFLCCLSCSLLSQVQEVIAFLVIDTENVQGGKEDLKNMTTFLSLMNDNESYSVSTTILTGSPEIFNENRIFKEFKEAEVDSNTIVFFYFSGHGKYNHNGIHYYINEEWIEARKFIKLLNAKASKALYYLSDNCQVFGGKQDASESINFPLTLPSHHIAKMFDNKKRLGLSCSPGSASISNVYQGGIFTVNFLKTYLDTTLFNKSFDSLTIEIIENTNKESHSIHGQEPNPYFIPIEEYLKNE